MAWGLQTYQDTGRREDLLDVIGDVSPDETPLLTLFGTSKVAGTLHEWLKYNLARPTSVFADVEGSDTVFGDLTQPSRANNITQIIKEPVRVSRTERKVNVAAMGDPYAFQKADRLRLLKMKMEYAVLNAAKASGASGVARQMDGIDNWITTNVTARNSGTSFSEQELNDITNDVWSVTDPDKIFDMVLCTFRIKQAIAGFGGNSTRYIVEYLSKPAISCIILKLHRTMSKILSGSVTDHTSLVISVNSCSDNEVPEFLEI